MLRWFRCYEIVFVWRNKKNHNHIGLLKINVILLYHIDPSFLKELAIKWANTIGNSKYKDTEKSIRVHECKIFIHINRRKIMSIPIGQLNFTWNNSVNGVKFVLYVKVSSACKLWVISVKLSFIRLASCENSLRLNVIKSDGLKTIPLVKLY